MADTTSRRATLEGMLAARGVVGRGVLIDTARRRGKGSPGSGEAFTYEDLEAAAAAQGVTIEQDAGAPIHVVGGTGAPVDPTAVK